MKNTKRAKRNLLTVANVVADLSLEGFCWFIFHQSKTPQALLEKKKEK